MRQMFFAEQTLEGYFVIVRYDGTMQYLVRVNGERYSSAEDAKARARELNEDYYADPEN